MNIPIHLLRVPQHQQVAIIIPRQVLQIPLVHMDTKLVMRKQLLVAVLTIFLHQQEVNGKKKILGYRMMVHIHTLLRLLLITVVHTRTLFQVPLLNLVRTLIQSQVILTILQMPKHMKTCPHTSLSMFGSGLLRRKRLWCGIQIQLRLP